MWLGIGNDKKRTIVIGGSMAGLTAARVWSEYVLEVTLVEPRPVRVT